MPTETQHLEQRVAALQSDLNARDQALDDAATENNERELSRRDWFEAAQAAEKRVEVLEQALRFYADGEHYHFESGNWDTVSGEPLNILWCGDEPDFIEDGTVAHTALSASAERTHIPDPLNTPERLVAEGLIGPGVLLASAEPAKSCGACGGCTDGCKLDRESPSFERDERAGTAASTIVQTWENRHE